MSGVGLPTKVDEPHNGRNFFGLASQRRFPHPTDEDLSVGIPIATLRVSKSAAFVVYRDLLLSGSDVAADE